MTKYGEEGMMDQRVAIFDVIWQITGGNARIAMCCRG